MAKNRRVITGDNKPPKKEEQVKKETPLTVEERLMRLENAVAQVIDFTDLLKNYISIHETNLNRLNKDFSAFLGDYIRNASLNNEEHQSMNGRLNKVIEYLDALPRIIDDEIYGILGEILNDDDDVEEENGEETREEGEETGEETREEDDTE